LLVVRVGDAVEIVKAVQQGLEADAKASLIQADEQHTIRRLVWVQFEGFLPANQRTYRYSVTQTVNLAGAQFFYDASTVDLEAAIAEPPDSDLAAARDYLQAHDYKMPEQVRAQRFVYLIEPDKRNELMIIYARVALGHYATVSSFKFRSAISMLLKLFYGEAKESGVIYSLNQQAKAQNTANYTTIVGDTLILPLIGVLAGENGPWAWPAQAVTGPAQASQNLNRVAFYQILLPSLFKIEHWFGKNAPCYYDNSQQYAGWYDLGTPEYAYAVYGATPQTDVYMLFAGDPQAMYPSGPGYPTQELMSDLLGYPDGNPEINPFDFWHGSGGWNVIAHYDYTGGRDQELSSSAHSRLIIQAANAA
jgi:hypothetical protein